MLTISLDEQGDFEGRTGEHKPVFIAGLIYDDLNESNDEKTERERINAYYKKVIEAAALEEGITDAEEAGFVYSEALHANKDKSRDSFVIKPVKEMVRKTIAEFFKDGTFKGEKLKSRNSMGKETILPDRKGKYYIFVYLKSAEGMKKYLKENTNILTNDNFASNLYFHMGDHLVKNLIFHNPEIEQINEVALNIASRASGPLVKYSKLEREYRNLGYRPNDGDDGMVYFSLTNADTYRSFIAEEIMDCGRTNLKFSDFSVRSITYKRFEDDSEMKRMKMEFLYLADSICSALGFKMNGNSEFEWFEDFKSKVHEMVGEDNTLIWIYDEIDMKFSKAWEYYEQGDYFHALSTAYDVSRMDSVYSSYYRDKWVKRLVERVKEKRNAVDYIQAVRNLEAMFLTNSVDNEKGLFIFKVLEDMIPAMEKQKEFADPKYKGYIFSLYASGITAYCHMGDSKHADIYVKKCEAYAVYVNLDDYLATLNKVSVHYCDYFDYAKAEELAEKHKEYQELLVELKTGYGIPGAENAGKTSMGKALSQLGQTYAFQRKDDAEDIFQNALSCFEEGSPNYSQTQSYLLHFLLDNGLEEKYREASRSYFGNRKTKNQELKYIIDNGTLPNPVFNIKFAFYVWIRGLYLFYRDEINDDLWNKIQNFEKNVQEKLNQPEWKLGGHPAELIFKYLQMIAIHKNDGELQSYYRARLEKCMNYQFAGDTIHVIRRFGEAEIADLEEKKEERDRITLELLHYVKENLYAFADQEELEDGQERFDMFGEKITFMYH